MHIYNPRYSGGGDRRTVVSGQPGQKAKQTSTNKRGMATCSSHLIYVGGIGRKDHSVARPKTGDPNQIIQAKKGWGTA
jgi:hypothetical protein